MDNQEEKNEGKFAFIITASIQNEKQLTYLIKSIRDIKKIYPNVFIYIINDNSENGFSEILNLIFNKEDTKVIDSIKNKGGEINPYLFILSPECSYDKLIYLHDSSFLKENIDQYILSTKDITFFYNSDKNILNDVIDPENKLILDLLKFKYLDAELSLTDIFNELVFLQSKKYLFDIKFGGMSIFTKTFVQKVSKISNFFDIVDLFKTRKNRSLFERILTIFYDILYDEPPVYICGDITQHLDFGKNLNQELKTGKALTKVWQGR